MSIPNYDLAMQTIATQRAMEINPDLWAHSLRMMDDGANEDGYEAFLAESVEIALMAGEFGPVPADDHWWWDPIGY